MPSSFNLCYAFLYSIPSKKYHICRTSNTVYDITDRKQFCSTMCFRASNYIRAQLLTSPLWLRDAEPMPQFQLMAEWRAPVQLLQAQQETTVVEMEDETHVEVLNATLQEMRLSDTELCGGIEKMIV